MLLVVLLLFSLAFGTVFVVERETGRLAVIRNDELVKEIEGLGNLNHATLKFFKGNGYLISRDGWLSLIDPERAELVKKVKVGESTIGINFCLNFVAVANYAPKTVELLSAELKPVKSFETGSRNVGIKGKDRLLLFALMDADEVWAVDCKTQELLKRIKVGRMPFDALLIDDRYVVGFFKEDGVGIVNLKDLSYRKVSFKAGDKEVVFKIPHFGFWGIKGERAYVPAVGERKLHVINVKNFTYEGFIPLPGLPVFAVVSPDGRFLAVNYSGDMEDYLTLVDLKDEKVFITKRLGRRILHFRFTPGGRHLYLSSYFENKVKKVSVPDLVVEKEISVPTPSGVFIYGGK
ncbi:MAG: NirF protein [Aquificae bacterium]|nr:NirF protein [Aquificota bacterium]